MASLFVSAFSTLLFGLDGSTLSNLKANNLIKLCYRIGHSTVFLPGYWYTCPFNLQIEDSLYVRVLILEQKNKTKQTINYVYRLWYL